MNNWSDAQLEAAKRVVEAARLFHDRSECMCITAWLGDKKMSQQWCDLGLALRDFDSPVAYSFVPSALSSQGTRRSRSPQAPVVVPTEVGDSAVDTTDLNQDTATLTETDNIARSSDLNFSNQPKEGE